MGYYSAKAWRNLIRTRCNDIAEAMQIQPRDFRWYAAFHDEGEHPHIHMMAWSAKPGQVYLDRAGIGQIKSVLMNDIFKQELLHIYEQKSTSRDELVRQARRELLTLVRTMQTGLCDHPEVETLIFQLAQGLETVRGKKSYGYLPKPLKALTDQIVDQMQRIPSVAQGYEKWQILQGQVDSYYGGDERKRVKLPEQKEFRAIKNAVIHEAESIRTGEITFEDESISAVDEPESTRYNAEFYRQYRDRIYDTDLPLDERDYAVEQMTAAAKAGNQFAQYTLGKLYLLGRGVPQNRAYAQQFLEQSAAQGNEYAQFFLDRLDQFRPPSVLLAATHLLRHMSNIFQDNSLPKSSSAGIHLGDRKREQEKKIALGHKVDDHEEYTGPTMSM